MIGYSSKRFSNGFCFPVRDYSSTPQVTDVSEYRPDSESVRALRVTGQLPTSDSLLYDYNDGKVTVDNTPSDLVLTLRSGTLDKADIQTIQSNLSDNAVDEVKASHDAAVSDAVDKALGVSSDSSK